MPDIKRQDLPIPGKEEKTSSDDDASEQDMKTQLSNTKARTFETNTSAIEPVSKRDNNIITTSSSIGTDFSQMTQEEIDLTIKVRNAGDALYDLVFYAIEKAKSVSSQKIKELVTKDMSPAAIAAKKDARDIAALGESVQGLVRTFESIMTEMRKQPYSERVHLLTGYKKLLKEQIDVIDSRINMVKRLR